MVISASPLCIPSMGKYMSILVTLLQSSHVIWDLYPHIIFSLLSISDTCQNLHLFMPLPSYWTRFCLLKEVIFFLAKSFLTQPNWFLFHLFSHVLQFFNFLTTTNMKGTWDYMPPSSFNCCFTTCVSQPPQFHQDNKNKPPNCNLHQNLWVDFHTQRYFSNYNVKKILCLMVIHKNCTSKHCWS